MRYWQYDPSPCLRKDIKKPASTFPVEQNIARTLLKYAGRIFLKTIFLFSN